MSNNTSKKTRYTKREARHEGRAYRQQLSASDLSSISKSICAHATEYLKTIKGNELYVHVYAPISRLKEIDTSTLIRSASKKHSVTIQSHAPFFPDEQFDVVFVPGLAFDTQGNRVGYGLGAYDRFLAHQPNARKVGIQFADLVLNSIESKIHDQKLDAIITEDGLLTIS